MGLSANGAALKIYYLQYLLFLLGGAVGARTSASESPLSRQS